MAKRIIRSIADHPPLNAWLMNNGTRFMWALDGDEQTPTVQAWRVGSGIVYVILHPTLPNGRGGGWDLVTAPNTNDIEATLADAAQRVGLKVET